MNKCPNCKSEEIYCMGINQHTLYLDENELDAENVIFMCVNCDTAFQVDIHATIDSFINARIIGIKPNMKPVIETFKSLEENENE